MRAMRRWVGLVLCVGVGAGCGEALSAPLAARGDVGTTDLELVLPPMKGSPALVMSKEVAPPPAWMDKARAVDAASSRGTTTERASISDTYLVAGFEGELLWFEYGMYGFGTGFEMKPTYSVMVGSETKLKGTTEGISLSLGVIATTFTPFMRNTISTGIKCGATATVSARYRVYIGATFDPFKVGFHAEKSAGVITSQPGCASTGNTGGTSGGGAPGGELDPDSGQRRITICYYELWVDAVGNVIAVVPLGCESITVGAAT